MLLPYGEGHPFFCIPPLPVRSNNQPLTDETAKKYTENGSELSEHFTPTCILKANGRRKRLSARAGNYTA